jgi:pimeloyl-ACP methyl ester carboxylesterase
MKVFMLLLAWVVGLALLGISGLSVLSRHGLASLVILAAALMALPPVRAAIGRLMGPRWPAWPALALIPVLSFLFFFLVFKGMGNTHSIYRTPEIERRLMAIYDAKMKDWPVPYEGLDLATDYGTVHVIVSGAEDAPALFLLHASAMSSWSWLDNVGALSAKFRTYAVDTIGDAGKSVLADVNRAPADGAALAQLYAGLMDRLGVAKASFIGASQGGFIATTMALHRPDRVDKIVLSGPMGYGGTNTSVLRILLTTIFPIKPFHAGTLRWAFGDDPRVRAAIGEWFRLILEGVISRQPRPRPFSDDELASLDCPVLLILGGRDGLVGDPERSKRAVRPIRDVRIEVLDAGHLVGAEKPDEFNRLVLDFLLGGGN